MATRQTQDAPNFPNDRTCPYQLPDGYRRLRQEEGPLRPVALYDGRRAWVVTGHRAARALLADPRLSADRTADGFPVTSPRGEAFRKQNRSFTSMDPPEHGPKRRMMISEFTVKCAKGMRPDIERIVHGFIDDLLAAGPPADLVTGLALPVASMVICELLGVPYADHEFFQDASTRLVQSTDPASSLPARNDLTGYLDGLITTLQADPGTGLLDTLIRERLATGEIDRAELVSSAVLLLVAGHETTASMTSLSVITLLEHPDQLDALRAEPSLIPGAVDELLRFLSIADIAGGRVATDDIEVDGQVIRAGDAVIVSNSIANRDGAVFADRTPSTCDVRPATTSRSATASTSAWGRTWPAWNSR
ncbi:MAG: cytochrome P450 [Pseudonocardia sp.]|nr:cytochrome P450 [Pseudonocardia sp.]